MFFEFRNCRFNLFLYIVFCFFLAIPLKSQPSPSEPPPQSFNCSTYCRPNMPYVDADCIPIGMQALGLGISLSFAFKLFRSHHGDNEWDTIGIGYKLFGGLSVLLAKETWDQINKCMTTAILVGTNERCRNCQLMSLNIQ